MILYWLLTIVISSVVKIETSITNSYMEIKLYNIGNVFSIRNYYYHVFKVLMIQPFLELRF